MKIKLAIGLFVLPSLYQPVSAQISLSYPITKKVNQVDDYFGTKVEDPYRWLEDDRSPETAEWVMAQNRITASYLESIPARDKIKKRLTEVWNYARYSAPFKEGEYYFFYKNDGIQNQSVLYYQKGLNGEPIVFLDPNKLSADGTTSLSNFSVSHNGKYAAYGISKGGSDWNEFYVMETHSLKQLPDHLQWIKFSDVAWQGNGFYYSRYDAPGGGTELSDKNEFHKVYFHGIGNGQNEDELVYQDKEHPQRNYGVSVTRDEKFAILYESESTSGTALYFKDLKKENEEFHKIAEGFDYEHGVIDNIGDKLLILTNKNAPRYRLVLMDPYNPAEANWKIVIPEKEEVLTAVVLAGGKIMAQYMKDACSKVFIYDMEGKMQFEIKLPFLGTLSSFSGKREDTIAFYSFNTFTKPATVYKYDLKTNVSTPYYEPKTKFDLSEFITDQVFYKSVDGTSIPMFIVYKKGLVLNGGHPTLLYGYGGFDISITPGFKIENVVFLENGGIYAVANIRGGGEYGEEWHKAGTKLNKQNVFDDFIAAAEYLIEKKYTSAIHLAISGRSNGGLLTGACMTQRPDLFKVALPAVGVMDMLRFHKFTIGWAWTSDYGSSDDSIQFKNLYSYSPLHHLKTGVSYPATLVTTADHDDRVVPAHSFKFLAVLQEKHKGENPVLGRIETMAGHGAGKPVAKSIEENTDILSFLFYNLGMDYK